MCKCYIIIKSDYLYEYLYHYMFMYIFFVCIKWILLWEQYCLVNLNGLNDNLMYALCNMLNNHYYLYCGCETQQKNVMEIVRLWGAFEHHCISNIFNLHSILLSFFFLILCRNEIATFNDMLSILIECTHFAIENAIII